MNLASVTESRIKITLRNSLLLFSALFLTSNFINAQPYVRQFDGIPFVINGENSYAPFNGGMNNARYQLIDIDADNDLDLFNFDSDTSLYFYKNIGTPQSAVYKLETMRFLGLSLKNWFYFADMDSDQDYDLFAGAEDQMVKYYRNVGTQFSPVMELMIPELRTATDTVIFSEANCVPIFKDLDNDGDLDFFTGQSLGTISYFENIGNSGTFSFRFVTDFWQDLIIISPALDNRHGANSLEFADIDNDNDYDLFFGDLFSAGIYYIQNNGSPDSPNVVIVDSLYPSNSPYISSGFNSTRLADIDADGDKDLFISVLYLSQNKENFTLYRNDGSAATPIFNRITDNYLRNFDVGGNSNPAFVDIDGDEDLDLFVGNDFARLTFVMNTGTKTVPAFNVVTDSLGILSTSFNYSPTFGDLDNDGDKDMILGSYIKDSLWLFRNNGTATNFDFVLEARGNEIGLTTLGQSSTPYLCDIDADNDLDLFIGGTNGRIIFYENSGNANSFVFTLVSSFYFNIDAGDESVPRLHDIDGDNDYDLFIGRLDGTIAFYRNTGTAGSASFELVTENYENISADRSSAPGFADIDNDGDLDLFSGNAKGGLFFWRNDEVSSIGNNIAESPLNFKLHQNFPNPFNPSTVIKFELSERSDVKMKIFDINGKEIMQVQRPGLSAGQHEFRFDAESLAGGIYFFGLQTVKGTEYIKMLYVK